MLHFEEVCSNLKRCAPGAVTAATEGGTGGREGMGASKNEEEATCQEQLLCSCSFAFVFPFFYFAVFICVSFYICLWFTFSLSFQQERKKRIARVAGLVAQEPPLPRPTPNTPKKTPCCVARATNTDFSRLHRYNEVFFKRAPG